VSFTAPPESVLLQYGANPPVGIVDVLLPTGTSSIKKVIIPVLAAALNSCQFVSTGTPVLIVVAMLADAVINNQFALTALE
jgi:hypothetical protein